MRRVIGPCALALILAACGGPPPDQAGDTNAGMMISNETIMSDQVGMASNAATPAANDGDAAANAAE